MKKEVWKSVKAEKIDMEGHLLDQPLPHPQVEYFDPFLLIHHAKEFKFGEQRARDLGVGPHPHRGFSPISFIYEGEVHHRDSLGNSQVVGPGGTQWLFAGLGITHSERPSKAFAESGGMSEMIQLWVNVPAKNKMDAPFYRAIQKEDTPTVREGNMELAIVCGKYKDQSGALQYFFPLDIWRIQFDDAQEISLPVVEGNNTMIYVLDGGIELNGRTYASKEMILFEKEGELIEFKALMKSKLLFLSGAMIGEKVSKYGPYVMTTQTEVMEALRDAQMGKMGILIEDFE